MEQESNQQPLFSTDSLEKFIRYYEDNSREGFMHFMDKNIQFFHEQQGALTKQMQDLLGEGVTICNMKEALAVNRIINDILNSWKSF